MGTVVAAKSDDALHVAVAKLLNHAQPTHHALQTELGAVRVGIYSGESEMDR